MELLVKRLLESGFVILHENPGMRVEMSGMRVDPLLLIATPQGREYFSSLGVESRDWAENE
jgi:hypothetical protein